MDFRTIPSSKKITLLLLSLFLLVTSALLIYALVYAAPESIYKKYAFIIGLLFLIIGRITITVYKSNKSKHSI